MKRVVVTGLGVVSPVGCSVQNFWENIRNGEDSPIPSKVGGVVTDFSFSYPSNHIERRLSRPVSFALEASAQCMGDSGIESLTDDEESLFGVCIGTGLGSPGDICDTWDMLREQEYKKIPPFFITQMLHSMVSSYVSIEHGCKGPVISLNTACATGAHCIGEGYRKIQSGECTRMLVGGTESAMDLVTYAGFCRIHALSTSFNDAPELSSRPFDGKRDGFVIGEGCGVLLLEEMECALGRENARIYGEIVGYGSTADSFHLTQSSPDGEGQVRAMNLSLREASIECLASEVDYVNAHATSTPSGDEIEYESISSMIKDSGSSGGNPVHISSIKGSIGHLMGASGAVEMIASVMSLNDDIIPPNINYEKSDFELCDELVIVENEALQAEVDCVLCNSFGFGGTNSSIVLKKFEM